MDSICVVGGGVGGTGAGVGRGVAGAMVGRRVGRSVGRGVGRGVGGGVVGFSCHHGAINRFWYMRFQGLALNMEMRERHGE